MKNRYNTRHTECQQGYCGFCGKTKITNIKTTDAQTKRDRQT